MICILEKNVHAKLPSERKHRRPHALLLMSFHKKIIRHMSAS